MLEDCLIQTQLGDFLDLIIRASWSYNAGEFVLTENSNYRTYSYSNYRSYVILCSLYNVSRHNFSPFPDAPQVGAYKSYAPTLLHM